MAAITVMEFTDPVFLSNYSLDAISAVAPTSIAIFLIVAFFGGVAGYVLLDALYMTVSGVLKGAGDTYFIMWSIGFVSLFVMILPVYIGIEIFQQGINYAWICVLMFITSLFIVTSARY